jgi:tetratricopeptide (TPR) repeat protein
VAGQWDKAIESYRTALTLNPGRIGAHSGIAESLLLKGEPEAALKEYAMEGDEEWRVKGTALAYFAMGQQAEFELAFAELRERWGDQWPSEVAHVYAYIGDSDSVFEWLNKAVEQNEDGLYQQFYIPLLKSQHDDPRWAEFRDRTLGSKAKLDAIDFKVNLPVAVSQ